MLVFISYAQDSPDEPFVCDLAARLEAVGWTVEFAGTMPAGSRWPEKIETWIDSADVFVAVLSPHSIQRDYVRAEITRAYNRWGASVAQPLTIVPIWLSLDANRLPLDIAVINSFQALKGNAGDDAFLDVVVSRITALPTVGVEPLVDDATAETEPPPKATFVDWVVSMFVLVFGLGVVVAIVFAVGTIGGWWWRSVRDILAPKLPAAIIVEAKAVDRSGKGATLNFILVAGRYPWQLASSVCVDDKHFAGVAKSSTAICINGVNIVEYIRRSEVSGPIRQLQDVIGVGVASCIGELENEGPRAIERAHNLATELKSIARPETTVWTLDLGQYQRSCQEPGDERRQRLALIVGVSKKDPNADIAEIVRKGLDDKHLAIFGQDTDPQHYKNWKMDNFRGAMISAGQGLASSR